MTSSSQVVLKNLKKLFKRKANDYNDYFSFGKI